MSPTAIISAVVAIVGTIITLIGIIVRLAVKINTLENGAKAMDKELLKLVDKQDCELRITRATLEKHAGDLAVLKTQMSDIKEGLGTINNKLDTLLTADLCSPAVKRKSKKRSVSNARG